MYKNTLICIIPSVLEDLICLKQPVLAPVSLSPTPKKARSALIGQDFHGFQIINKSFETKNPYNWTCSSRNLIRNQVETNNIIKPKITLTLACSYM